MKRTLACVAALAWVAASCSEETDPLGDRDLNVTYDTSTAKPCEGPQDCDDGDGCTTDTCLVGRCDHKPRDCNDQNPCTEDTCEAGTCRVAKIEGCCISDSDCDDQDWCTPDKCQDRACTHGTPPANCCTTQAQCDDQNECTFDDCNNHKCSHTVVTGPNCCSGDFDCLDSNVCTRDRCKDGKCVYESLGCCTSDAECVTTTPCQVGQCTKNGGTGTCTFDKDPNCCVTAADCAPRDCFSLACEAPKCIWTPLPDCCTADADCGGDPCIQCQIPQGDTKGACHVRLTPECCVAEVVTQDFGNGLGGWVVEGLSGYPATPTWTIDAVRYHSAPASLFFGDLATRKISPQKVKVGARLRSPELDLGRTRDPVLEFRMWKNTELVPSNDVVSFYVFADGQETRVWSTASDAMNQPSFQAVQVSLGAFEGSKVRLVLEFDTMDGHLTGNVYEGVSIDDIHVSGMCQ